MVHAIYTLHEKKKINIMFLIVIKILNRINYYSIFGFDGDWNLTFYI